MILLGEIYLSLEEVGKAVKIAKSLEKIDINTNDILKDKLILYADIYNYAISVAESIRERVEIMTLIENTTVTISMGLSYSGDKYENMIKRADNSLYKSKTNGKNRLTYK